MLFNSPAFIFVFLPIVLLGFFILGKTHKYAIAMSWLVGASLVFYAWWNPVYIILLISSIVFNFAAGRYITSKEPGSIQAKGALIIGVVANLGLLGYFKYVNFFVDTLDQIGGLHMQLSRVVLPLAISFFTFTQIAYLVDASKGLVKDKSFLRYCLSATSPT